MRQVHGVLVNENAENDEAQISDGGNVVLKCSRRWFTRMRSVVGCGVSIRRWRRSVAILLIGVSAAVVGKDIALADDVIAKKDTRLIYLVGEEGDTVAIWAPDVEEGEEDVTGNTIPIPVPADLAEKIADIVNNPDAYEDGTLEYIIVVKGSASVRRCHSHSGGFHCHPPRD